MFCVRPSQVFTVIVEMIPSGRPLCPRLQLRGSAGFTPASLVNSAGCLVTMWREPNIGKSKLTSQIYPQRLRKSNASVSRCKIKSETEIWKMNFERGRSFGWRTTNIQLIHLFQIGNASDPTRATFSSANRVTRSSDDCSSAW